MRWAVALTVVLLAVTAGATRYTNGQDDRQARQLLVRDAEATVDAIDRRMQSYGEALLGVRGLFESGRPPNRARFAQYMRSLQVDVRHPGVRVVAYAPVVQGFQRPAFQRVARRSASDPRDPLARFAIRPGGRRARYVPVRYLEPSTGNEAALGLDLLSEPRRATALTRTQRTGQLAATAPLHLVQTVDRTPGFLLMAAVRRVGGPLSSVRTGRLSGVVTAAFDSTELFGRTLMDKPRDVDVEIYDSGAAMASRKQAGRRRLYDSDGRWEAARWTGTGDTVIRRVSVAGRRWTVYYRHPSSATSGGLPIVVGALGALVSLLVGCLVLLLARGRARALAIAARMTNDLQASHASLQDSNAELRATEERVRRIIEIAPEAFVSIDDAGRITRWNPAAERMFGWRLDEAVGRSLADTIVPERFCEAHREGLARFLRTETGTVLNRPVEMTGQRRDGTEVPIELSISAQRDGDRWCFNAFVRDVSERKRFEGQLQHLADHDSLTGLLNRRRFEEELQQEIALADRYQVGGALLALDLDNFKDVNDTLGHAAGDVLLQTVARLLRGRIRETDILARLGGDEFAVLLRRADETQARQVADDIVALLREQARVVTSKGPCHTTVSIGIALLRPADRDTVAEQLLIEADIAMYDAKEAGRDGVALFDPAAGRHTALQADISWTEQIRQAIAEDRLALDAQAIVPLCGHGPPRHELLLRMITPSGDRILPAAFLSVAERSSLVEQIDRWVIRHAADILAVHQRSHPDVQVQLNVSGRSITDPGLAAFIAAELHRANADPAGLVIEVTETAAIVNIDRARTFARELRDLGARFAIDDFGAGFASFFYLKHLDFDILKIDGEFITGLSSNHTNQVLVRSIVDIAHGLGKETVAECVGDAETAAMLCLYGIDHGQGYFLGRPQPVAETALALPQPG